jgi:hypothetical protein
MWYIVEWKGNKYVYSTESSAWYGHYGRVSDGYPGDNYMVPLRDWGELFAAAKQQGISISRSAAKSVSVDEGEDDDEVKVKVKKSAKTSSKKFGKSISIFGE